MSNGSKPSFKKDFLYCVKVWTFLILPLGFFITIVQLWGTQVPLKYYPILFLKASIPVWIISIFLTGLALGWRYIYRKKGRE